MGEGAGSGSLLQAVAVGSNWLLNSLSLVCAAGGFATGGLMAWFVSRPSLGTDQKKAEKHQFRLLRIGLLLAVAIVGFFSLLVVRALCCTPGDPMLGWVVLGGSVALATISVPIYLFWPRASRVETAVVADRKGSDSM